MQREAGKTGVRVCVFMSAFGAQGNEVVVSKPIMVMLGCGASSWGAQCLRGVQIDVFI